jgi:colicin import membrane protein
VNLLSEEKKESKVEVKSTENSVSEKPSVEDTKKIEDAKIEAESKAAQEAASKVEANTQVLAEAEAAVKLALEKANTARSELEAAADDEYKAIAAEVKADIAKKSNFTFKRKGEEIFRREMGEPEFWLDKKDRFPRPILTQDQQESITRIAETPQDQTPKYDPQHILSPEHGGVSNYENGVNSFLDELKSKLTTQKSDPESTTQEILATENEITYLESIHENFYIGMNVFRTAKGGRDKLNA